MGFYMNVNQVKWFGWFSLAYGISNLLGFHMRPGTGLEISLAVGAIALIVGILSNYLVQMKHRKGYKNSDLIFYELTHKHQNPINSADKKYDLIFCLSCLLLILSALTDAFSVHFSEFLISEQIINLFDTGLGTVSILVFGIAFITYFKQRASIYIYITD
ncbi:MAG: hypothetical protein ACI8Q1_002467 [Parvicella sp.]|jgi:hypothetical protein